MDVKVKKLFWILIATSIILTLQLSTSTASRPRIMDIGFSKIKPLLVDTYLSPEGNFTGVFTNRVGEAITVKKITLEEQVTNTKCTIQSSPTTVKAGEDFKVNAFECGVGLKGDLFVLNVTLEYEIKEDKTTRREEGTLRGVRLAKPTPVEEILGNFYLTPVIIILILFAVFRINLIKSAFIVSIGYIIPYGFYSQFITLIYLMTLGLLAIPAYLFFKKQDLRPVKKEYWIAVGSVILGIILGSGSFLIWVWGLSKLVSYDIQESITMLFMHGPFILTTGIFYLKTKRNRALLLGVLAQIIGFLSAIVIILLLSINFF